MPMNNLSFDDEEKSKKELWMSSASSCPPFAPTSTAFSMILLMGLIYGTLWGFMGDPVLPGGPVFALFVMVIVCYLGGQFTKLLKAPTLVGMMVMGFIMRNVPYIKVADDIPEEWAANIRQLALVLILLRAGLEVDSDVLQKNKATCLKLLLVPFTAECCMAALLGHYFLHLPLLWGFLFGFMLSAVSPAVVLPVMLKLQKKGIGVTNGVPTMVIAIAGIADVLALTGFEIILGIIFSNEKLGWTIAKGPLQMLIGIVYGVLLGFLAWYLPNPEEKSRSVLQFMILTFGGMCAVFGSQALGWGAVGALGCICLPFVAAIRWKKSEAWHEDTNPVEEALAFIWRIIEPFLFGLIGSEIRVNEIQPSTIGLGMATLLLALGMRMVFCFVGAIRSGLTMKEQTFVTFAGVPKATVQAAIGPVALSLAKQMHLGDEYEGYGIRILTVAVLAILTTAPLGALAISLLAPRLLDKDDDHEKATKEAALNAFRISVFDNSNCACQSYSCRKEDGKMPNNINNSNVYIVDRL